MANLGLGRGGKSFQDRALAAKVRNKALEEVYLVLSDDPKIKNWSPLKQELLLKMGPNVLPKLSEVTGGDGEPLFEKLFSDNQLETVINHAASKIQQNRNTGGDTNGKRKSH